MSDYLGHGWLVGLYLRDWREMARLLEVQIVPRLVEPLLLGHVR